jgi:hypothetical protein
MATPTEGGPLAMLCFYAVFFVAYVGGGLVMRLLRLD